MKQLDWVTAVDSASFRDIRNQKPSTAQEKAILLMTLGKLLRTVPDHIKSCSVQAVREWRAAHARAAQIAAGKKSSVHDIQHAIASMRAWEKGRPQ